MTEIKTKVNAKPSIITEKSNQKHLTKNNLNHRHQKCSGLQKNNSC